LRSFPKGASIIPDGESIDLRNDIFARLTARSVITPTGGVLGGATIWESCGKEHLLLAELVRKKVAYELVAQGHALCAVIGDTMLIEAVASSTDGAFEDLASSVKQTIRPVFGDLLGDLPVGCRTRVVEDFVPGDYRND
jgi:hypothetical protein